ALFMVTPGRICIIDHILVEPCADLSFEIFRSSDLAACSSAPLSASSISSSITTVSTTWTPRCESDPQRWPSHTVQVRSSARQCRQLSETVRTTPALSRSCDDLGIPPSTSGSHRSAEAAILSNWVMGSCIRHSAWAATSRDTIPTWLCPDRRNLPANRVSVTSRDPIWPNATSSGRIRPSVRVPTELIGPSHNVLIQSGAGAGAMSTSTEYRPTGVTLGGSKMYDTPARMSILGYSLFNGARGPRFQSSGQRKM